MEDVRLMLGDCTERLVEVESSSIDAVICDPPYPCIDRPYGRMTEAEWHAMMDVVVPECRRVLKPSGSAVFVLQPNSERVGRMRPWLWEFMAKWTREWGMVQDAWWWNHAAMPNSIAIQGKLLRPSIKACVWLGSPDCYRNQGDVLWSESFANASLRTSARCGRTGRPSGHSVDEKRISQSALDRGGVLPFNVLPIANTNSTNSAGSNGHGAGTPEALCDWWTRYISPPEGTILDPFIGSGTVGLAAIKRGRSIVGIERDPGYFAIAERRINEALNATPLFS